MMPNKYLPLLVFLMSCKCDDQLIAVTVIVRHGVRIPLSFYPTDPYQNASWPFALGDLANKGVQEMFNAGQWLRRTYSSFLSREYIPDEIYAEAAEFERCLMTAESTLAGLYPPTKDEIWNSHVRWQPVPVHSSPLSQDIVANMLRPCPGKVAAAAAAMENSTEYPKIMKKYGSLLAYMSKNSGQTIEFSSSLYPLYDTLNSEKTLGLKLPEWAEKIFPELFPMISLYAQMSSILPEERRIQVGPLITRIVNQFEKAISQHDFGTTETIYRKFMAYFSTEWTMYDFTYGLGLKNIHVPGYGALFLIELRKKTSQYYVNILFRNSSAPGTVAQPWHFEGQKFDLNFETFKQYAAPLRINTTSWVPLCDSFVHEEALVRTGVPMS